MIKDFKNLVVLDCEVYPNYILIAFKSLDKNKILTFEIIGEDNRLSKKDTPTLIHIMKNWTTFGFNSIKYDMFIILYAISGAKAKEIYNLSERIIGKSYDKLMPWDVEKIYGIKKPNRFEHFDIMEVAPGVAVSLKLYGGRIHSKVLQDLPIEPGTILTTEQIRVMKDYCVNDLDTTIDLYGKIKEQMELRLQMSSTYGVDLMSKSDAQIAEEVIKRSMQGRASKNKNPGSNFKYEAPDFIRFKTPRMRKVLQTIESATFGLDNRGSIELPKEISNMNLTIGDTEYQMGVGGLHSKESSQVVIPNDDQLLIDKDVTSYYPSIILNLGLYPKHLGPLFLKVYKGIVDERLLAKRDNLKTVSNSLKIVINGLFGKFGNKYSVVYSPELLLKVTLTGQLSLLMLIESLELEGFKVVSANTDGFVTLLDSDDYEMYETLCFDWELATKFNLEETRYKGLYSRDVNNYFAVTDYGTKGKGVFAAPTLSKNPQGYISTKAVIEYLTKGIPIHETITKCENVEDFLHVRKVNGGAVWGVEYLGKAVRWIYSNEGKQISYGTNGNKVAKSDGARPLMNLDGTLPDDIDYGKYIDDSHSIMRDLGYERKSHRT